MLDRFAGECELIGRLHHPCVVQFLGVCFEQGSPLPVPVMEYLHTTLSTCLERYGVLPKEMSYAWCGPGMCVTWTNFLHQ